MAAAFPLHAPAPEPQRAAGLAGDLPARRLNAAPFAWRAQPLLAAPAPAIHFGLASAGAANASHLGGLPRADPDFLWPSAEDLETGAPKHPRLLARILLDGLGSPVLPTSGALLFFEPHHAYRRGSLRGDLVQFIPASKAQIRHQPPSRFHAPLPEQALAQGGAAAVQLCGEIATGEPELGTLLLALPGWQYRIPGEDLAARRFDRVFICPN